MIIDIPFEPGFRRTIGPAEDHIRLPVTVRYSRGANLVVAATSGGVAAFLAAALFFAAIRAPSACATYWDLALVLLTFFVIAVWIVWHAVQAAASVRFALMTEPALRVSEREISIERFRDPIMWSDVISADFTGASPILAVRNLPWRRNQTWLRRLFDFCLEMIAYAQSRRKLRASEVRVSYGELELGSWAVKHVILALAKARA